MVSRRGLLTLIVSCWLLAGHLFVPVDVPAAISPEELQKIEAAVPDRAAAEPLRHRKLLVFSLVGGNHTAGPYGAKALELMAARTGAFEVTHATDPSIFKAENLKPFDAVCFNNANRLKCFDDPVLCRGLLQFVKGGKGLVGIHAAATNFSARWGCEGPEGAEMLGGIFFGHPWHEKVAIQLADPDHPLNAAFGGQGFEITDEIYQFTGPHSKETLRILLRVDETKTDMDKRNKMDRPDDDFAVSWVRSYGKGRVFYCSLGHDHDVFWNPAVLRHYLDGIQFALGDLPADMTPTAALPRPDRQKKPKPAGEDRDLAITDPAEAGPDFLVQGEYVGKIARGDRWVDHGVQVVALGGGEFRSVTHVGGLPGAGWNGSDKLHASGTTGGDVTTFVTEDGRGRATVQRGVMTVTDPQGNVVGRLSRVVRRSPTLGAEPPAGALVLFDGSSTDAFDGARMTPDGLLMEPATSRRKFQSYRSHIEFRVPFMPYARGQGRGNNGYFCQGRYQVQILDSFGLEATKGDCGAIYGLAGPKVNMCFPPLSWQTFDVEFTAAEFRDGKKVRDARMTVYHNGVLVHDDVAVGATSAGALIKTEGPEPGPLFVQSHKAPLRFRNIWVVEKSAQGVRK